MEKQTPEFTPPRHWVGPEQLSPEYWADAAEREKRGQEFFEKPIETIARIDQTDSQGIARRDFLTIMGASMAMATFACARRPLNKIVPYVVKPEEMTLGLPLIYASTINDAGVSYGVLVKTREGRPIKIEGNPEHPVNESSTNASVQAALLELYDPDRLKAPVQRARGSASTQEVSWSEADAAVAAKLKAAGAGRVRFLSEAILSETTLKLTREVLGPVKGELVEYEPLAQDEIAEAQALSYGSAVVPHYRFDRASVVVSLGADFLGTWVSPTEYSAAWARARKLNSKNPGASTFGKLFSFESGFTITGANADERVPVRPGDELKIALALANEIIVVNRNSHLAGDSAVAQALADYRADAVAQEIGISVATIKNAARELWSARGKSLVVAGGATTKTESAAALQVAVNLLNSALENEGATVDGTAGYSVRRDGAPSLIKLIAEMKAGQVDVLVINAANPVFNFPQNVSGIEDALKKVPFVVVLADRENETAQFGDYVLPLSHALESWGDASPRRGVYSLQQPTMAPIYATRSFEEALLGWVKAGAAATGAAAQTADWHGYLQGAWKELLGASGRFEAAWENALQKGVHLTSSAGGSGSARSFRAGSLAGLPKYVPANAGDVKLALYQNNSVGDGRYANNAWMQEMPDPISSVTWDNYAALSPALAKKYNLKTDDVVEISAGGVKAELPVYVQPGLHPQVVAVAAGYGRRLAGKVGNGTGVDVYPFAQVLNGRVALSGQTVSLRKTARFYRLATTQWHTVSENRPIINDITLAEFKKNPGAANETDPELRLETVPTIWPKYEYKGFRWGMAIDLTSCFGCGACTIACQAENNIPVVGRDQVRNSRQMHWIRIDRYYTGPEENPDVVFQPMLCQHCENAPCETVCPVLATVHDDEGLNIQVYNRCVGTRYCQNNCPYKVRRFNFFDHWKSYEGTLNLAWNPEVTVRSRGIMEKCTFCIQRIIEAKDKAKDEAYAKTEERGSRLVKKLKDGVLQTACQQVCPTDAIIFGDINDPESRVSELHEDARAFRVLETLNTKPSISYLTKVRNKEEASHGHHS